MIKKSILIFSLLALVLFLACERDDICAESTPTTPQLVIQFFDADNISDSKPINLDLIEVEREDTLFFTGDTLIRIPLKTNTESTQFRFTKNRGIDATAEEPENEDIITFNYTTNEVYISRACGFKVTYDDLSLINTNGPDGRWIEDITINSESILDENTTHVSIYH